MFKKFRTKVYLVTCSYTKKGQFGTCEMSISKKGGIDRELILASKNSVRRHRQADTASVVIMNIIETDISAKENEINWLNTENEKPKE